MPCEALRREGSGRPAAASAHLDQLSNTIPNCLYSFQPLHHLLSNQPCVSQKKPVSGFSRDEHAPHGSTAETLPLRHQDIEVSLGMQPDPRKSACGITLRSSLNRFSHPVMGYKKHAQCSQKRKMHSWQGQSIIHGSPEATDYTLIGRRCQAKISSFSHFSLCFSQ